MAKTLVIGGVTMPCPSKFEYALQDVSAADSGRTEDALMWKNRVAQKVKINLEWVAVSDADAATIMTAVDPEYFEVTYHDPKANAAVTKTFYRGDVQAPYYWWVDNGSFSFSTISFNIIER